jgi:2-oxo-3-hexenedioate decarboxylase
VTGAVAWAPGALDAAQREGIAIDQLPIGLSLAEAYEIQRDLIALRIDRGDQLVGAKLGFTSKAKMAQMGVSEIIVGRLTNAMRVDNNGPVELARFIHPRIEPEIAFRLSRDLDDSITTESDIAEYVDAVAPGLEIIDSRYRDFRFDLAGVVADNASAAGFVVGEWQPLSVNLADCAVSLLVDGQAVETGSTSAIMGHPATAVQHLIGLVRRYGLTLRAGDTVLAGAATAAAPFGSGVVEARITGLGSAVVSGVV